jgi:hypothetical protein
MGQKTYITGRSLYSKIRSLCESDVYQSVCYRISGHKQLDKSSGYLTWKTCIKIGRAITITDLKIRT